jgi:hypothetical protein
MPNSKPLLLSFNFKEEYNEYWAVAGEGVFFLQDENGVHHAKRNRVWQSAHPAAISRRGGCPLYSFVVPNGTRPRRRKVGSGHIESYAVGVNIGEDYPRTFSIDDIEVSAPADFKTLTIQGTTSVAVPATGEHREQYTAHLGSPVEQTALQVHAAWELRQPHDPGITIDINGGLTVSADVQDESVTLVATYSQLDNPINQ